MLSNLLTVALANAKLLLAAGVGAALVAGGGAVAISTVSADVAPDPVVTEQVVTEDSAKTVDQSVTASGATNGDAGGGVARVVTSPSDSGTAGIKPDNHGACVSAVARDKQPGESGRDHGKRVSAAAKSCPKGGDDTEGAKTADADEDEAAEDADDAAKAERKATKRAEKADRKQIKRAEKADRKQGKQGKQGKRDSGETDD